MFTYIKLFIILLIVKCCFGNNFIVVARENSFFQPCDDADNGANTNMHNLIEFQLKHDYADDMETLISNGNATIKVDIPQNILIMLDLEVFEWKRGKWETTLYSIRRNDFCAAVFDSTEIWYSLTKQIAQEDRICPPKKGITYHFNNVKNRIELDNIGFGLDLEGQYKVVAHFIADQFSTCITSTVNIWKN